MGALATALLLALLPVPALTGPVVDNAGMLDAAARERLEGLARAARAEQGGAGVQLQILTVLSLQDEPIEDFSIRVAEAWKIGTKGRDNGLLFTVSRADRKYRLEVGGGLEGDLTDAQAKRILDERLAPAFRAGDFGGGLYAASVAALQAVHALPAAVASDSGENGDDSERGGYRPGSTVARVAGAGLLFFLLRHVLPGLLMILVLVFMSFRRRRGAWAYVGGGGSGWRGGSSSGGGWGGGGGGFSGGGASGGW